MSPASEKKEAAPAPSVQKEPAEVFVLEDLLNRSWTNELVTFPVSEEQIAALQSGKALIGPDGKSHPYQIDGDSLAFAVNLSPYERKEFRIADGAKAAETDLKVTETDAVIELNNGRTGVRINKRLEEAMGPIAGIMLSDGTWTSGSRLNLTPAEYRYEISVAASGPVFSEVEVRLTRGEGDEETWSLTFRLQAGEPVVLVDEVTTLGEGENWEVELAGEGFAPNHILHRAGWMAKAPFSRGFVYATEIEPNQNNVFYQIQPWVQWWRNFNAKWVGLYDDQDSALLFLAARDAEVWAEVREGSTNRLILGSGAKPFTLFEVGDRPFVKLPLVACRRNWLIGSVDKQESLAQIEPKSEGGGQDPFLIPVPQQYVIKYEFPLDEVKDLVLEWEETEDHPRLLLTKKQLTELQENPPSDNLQGAPAALIYEDEAAQRELVDQVVESSNGLLGVYLEQNRATNTTSFGMAPHHHYGRLASTLIGVDSALSVNALTEEERRRLRAQAAFVGYTVTRDDFWSPERGYANHLNMSSFVAGMQVSAGSLLASHPMGEAWANKGLGTLISQLENSSGLDGGWQETPHYAMAAFDTLLAAFTMAQNSGYADMLDDPRLKNIAEWFAKVSTPPDSRFHGRRHWPHIGHTYLYETSGGYGVFAALWQEKDPEFAGNMRWMWDQHGNPSKAGIGGRFPMFGPYRGLLLGVAETVEPVAPAYGSDWFRDTGVIFRSGFPSDRETMMTVIAGKNHDHYDRDSGSFTLWGKGRIVSDDFGYSSMGPATEHNMVTSQFSRASNLFHVSDFYAGEWMDYMKGTANEWTRQIVFIKDEDPLRPNYFVIRDSFPKPGSATSRTFFVAESVELTERGASVIGKEDVDTDVFYAYPPGLELATEEKTTSGHGAAAPNPSPSNPNRVKEGKMDYTQIGLLATVKSEPGFMAVIYPRLKNEAAPTFTSFAEGRGVKVESEVGTDYVFLSEDPFTFEEGGITFEGTVGTAQLREEGIRLSLGAGGRISFGDFELVSEEAREDYSNRN
ncbi:hypothetical protein J3R74_000601 [Puniceicoccus vermicola]